jgi:DNA-binding MltR family transcriptional regulator
MMLTTDLEYVIEKSAGKDIDRAMAITEAASLELLLMTLLKSYMRRGDVAGRLFERSGPLSSLSAKIDCAYALRLIDKRTWKDLDCIRKIRNKFAHSMVPLCFADDQVHELCEKISTFSKYEDSRMNTRGRLKKAIEEIYKHLGEKVVEVLQAGRPASS